MKWPMLGIAITLFCAGCTHFFPAGGDPVPENGSRLYGNGAAGTVPEDPRLEELERRDDATIVIRQSRTRTIKVYRVAGVIQGIQVIPKKGPPYFLVPAHDPNYFIRADRPDILIPSWQIFQWN